MQAPLERRVVEIGVGRIAAEQPRAQQVGGAMGVAVAFGIVNVFKAIGGHGIPRLDAVTTGWPLLAAGCGAALLATLLAGL